MYFPGNRENLLHPIQMEQFKKLKTCSECFTAFLKCKFHSKHFEKKYDSHGLCLSQIVDCEIRVYVNV